MGVCARHTVIGREGRPPQGFGAATAIERDEPTAIPERVPHRLPSARGYRTARVVRTPGDGPHTKRTGGSAGEGDVLTRYRCASDRRAHVIGARHPAGENDEHQGARVVGIDASRHGRAWHHTLRMVFGVLRHRAETSPGRGERRPPLSPVAGAVRYVQATVTGLVTGGALWLASVTIGDVAFP